MSTYKRRYKCAEACNTCKRRKERCDGTKPCARCVQRNVQAACEFRPRQLSMSTEENYTYSRNDALLQAPGNLEANAQHIESPEMDNPLTHVTSHTSSTSVPEAARLLQDTKGRYMFIGDSATLSLLRTIRNLVTSSIGSCPFVDDPFREQMVESAPEGAATWLHATETQPPIKPSLEKGIYLIRRYSLATKGVMDLFNEGELLDTLPVWLNTRSGQEQVLSTIYYLVFAIGAQTCPEDQDILADLYFDHGRYLTASYLMEDPSIATVQAYAMVTMYLLGASRRNAAFMYLGTAVRAAYALGLHRSDIATLFPPAEIQTRERLWKVLRTLDLFLSASLGRPPSTEETRNTERDEGYSAITDLCSIFERILTDVYAKRMITTDNVQKISERHRLWTLRFHRGLEADQIDNQECPSVAGLPNIGLFHVKAAYYWTIILLTRPFFVEYISRKIARQSQSNRNGQETPDPLQSSDQILVHACVNSAICTVDMLKALSGSKEIPKRLPFVVNSLFVSSLVMGLAYFGDLYKIYPLDDGLRTSIKLLALFPYDAIAKRNLTILESLLDACNFYVKHQKKKAMARHAHLVSGMFGHIDNTQAMGMPNASGLHHDQTEGFVSSLPTGQTHQDFNAISSIGGNSESTIFNIPDNVGNDAASLTSSSLNQLPTSLQDDFSILPILSPRTLWFGSYEENMPLFSTIDGRDFVM